MRAVVLGVLLCGSLATARAVTSAKPPVFQQLAQVPDEARLLPNPLADHPDSVPAGQKLYARHCASCHGPEGKDGGKGPSLRVEVVQEATPGSLFWVVTNGAVRAGMPVWSRLPEPQRWQIVTYLQSLGVEGEGGSGPGAR